jgi:hypothetical protein
MSTELIRETNGRLLLRIIRKAQKLMEEVVFLE